MDEILRLWTTEGMRALPEDEEDTAEDPRGEAPPLTDEEREGELLRLEQDLIYQAGVLGHV